MERILPATTFLRLSSMTLDGLDLGAGERHFVVELLVGDVVEVNKFVEPISA